MNLNRYGGWALILSAVISLFGLVWFRFLDEANSMPLVIIGLVGTALLIVGLPAIQSMQPQTGSLGMLGLFLIGIAALVALIVTYAVQIGNASVDGSVPFASALVGFLGSILVGWLTIRVRVFPAWIGWLLILGAAINFLTGLIPVDLAIIADIGGVLSAAAIAGYGLTIVQRQLPVTARRV